ncbi:MAG: DciA family protein [Thermaurantimonas sp.]
MIRKNEQTLAEVLKILKEKYGWGEKMLEVAARNAWYKLLGPVAANHTVSIHYNKQVLTIKLNSSVLREELWMHKEKLLRALNEELDNPDFEIKKIILL